MHILHRHYVNTRSKNTASNMMLALLMSALLSSQLTGLLHRSLHGGVQTKTKLSSHSVSTLGINLYDFPIKKTHHSCLAFDTAALGDALYAIVWNTHLARFKHVIASWLNFISWSVPFTRQFYSRAPPHGAPFLSSMI